MYRSRQKKWIYNALTLILVIQLCFGLSGIFDDNVFADKPAENKLDIPSNIQTSATDDAVTLKWDPVSTAQSYDVEINGNVTEGITANEHTFTGLEPNTEYEIKVRAIDENSGSEWSNPVVQKTAEAEPIQTENPAVTPSSEGNNQGEFGIPTNIAYLVETDSVVFSWDEVTGAESYDVEINNKLMDNITVTEYVYGDIDLQAEYIFRVRSANGDTKSEWSEEVRVQVSDNLPMEEEIPRIKQDPVIGNGNGLEGEYYDNRTLKDLAFIRKDKKIDFNWGTGTPDPSIKKNSYSIRWTGKLLADYSAPYTIYTYTGDGIRLWLDGELIIDDWKSSAIRENKARVELNAGQKYDIEIEYFNNNKESIAVVSWSCAYHDKEVIPKQQLFCKPDIISGIHTIAEGSNMTVSWESMPGAESYELEVDGEVIDNGMQTVYVHEGLTANTEHTYRVRAVNDVSDGDWTELITKVSAPATPESLAAVIDTTNILVSWDSVDAATGYDIEVNGRVIDNGDATSYLHDGLNPNTKCTYRVRAKNENGISDWTGILTKTTLPATPEDVKVEPTYRSMLLSWDAVNGAISYEIEAEGQLVQDIQATEYAFEGLLPDEFHTYMVRARNIEGAGYWSEPITKKTLLETPAGITSDITDKSIMLAWLPVNRATGYEIEIDGSDIAYTTEAAFVDEGLLPNSEHSYRIRAKNDDNISKWSEKVVRLTFPDTPRNLVSDSTSYVIDISWEDIPGATSYDIEVDGRTLDNGLNTAYTHEGLSPKTVHEYRVRAKSAAGSGYWSELVSEATKVGVPANVAAEPAINTIKLEWSAVAGADSYEIDADGQIVNGITAEEYLCEGLLPDTMHNYKVRAVDEDGAGDWSGLTSKKTLLETPTNIKAEVTDKTITLTWSSINGATAYDVEVDGKVVENGLPAVFAHENLIPNSQHTYSIKAKNADNISNWSKRLQWTTLPDTPKNVTTTATSCTLTLTWEDIPGAIAYDLEVDGEVIENGVNTTFIHADLVPNTEHLYRVRAKSIVGNGYWSTQLNKYTAPHIPEGIMGSTTSTTVTMAWNQIAEANYYEIEFDGVMITDIREAGYQKTALQPNSEHKYRIRAVNEAGRGDWSEYSMNTTAPHIPANINTLSTSRTITFTWDEVSEANRYEIELDGVVYNINLETTYEYVDLLTDSAHTYRIRSINEIGFGDWSELATKLTAPDIPGNITAASTSTSITLTWDAVEAAAGYDVEVLGSPVDNGNNTAYTHMELNPYTQRTYRVRAKNENGLGDWSEIIARTTLPGIPANLSTNSTESTIIFAWDPVAGAAAYDVEVDDTTFADVMFAEYRLSGLSPNSQHTFRVRSKNGDGNGDWSTVVKESTLPAVPVITAVEASDNSVRTVWESVYETMEYDIEVDGLVIECGTNSEYIHQNILPNTEHTYRVRAKSEYAIGNWGELIEKLTLPDIPKGLAVETASSSAKLSWGKVDGAIGYEIEADGIILSAGIDAAFLNENLTPNTEHIYRVRAKSEAGLGKWSVEARAFTLFGMPQNIRTFASGNSIKTVWDQVYGVTGYEVEADGSLFEIGPDTEFIHSELMPNTTHIYRIRAKKEAAAGDWSERTITATLLASIADIQAVSAGTTITFNWTPIGDAESYDVEVDGIIVTGILEPIYKVEGLLPNTPHTFRVMAKSETNASGWSELITKYTTPNIPGNIKLDSKTSVITLSWDLVEGAIGYEVEADGAIVDNGTKLSYAHEGLGTNTQHIYRLRAKNEHEASEWSAVVIGTTEPELLFNIAEDNVFNFVITAPKVTNAVERKVTVTYNPNELEVVDLCAATSKKDFEVGEISGTNLEIKELTPGTIVFSLKDPSKAIMNAIKFKAKINGQSKVVYVIE